MHDKHNRRTFGEKISNPRHWEKGLDITSEILNAGGKSLAVMGASTGQPELALLGGGAIEASDGAKHISKILKKNIKKKHTKKKKK
jgi:hypothetical protein